MTKILFVLIKVLVAPLWLAGYVTDAIQTTYHEGCYDYDHQYVEETR